MQNTHCKLKQRSILQKHHHLQYKDSKISSFCKPLLFCNVCMSINAVFVRLKERRRKRKRKKKKQEKKEPKKRIKNKEIIKKKKLKETLNVCVRAKQKANFLHTSNKVCKTPAKHLPAVWRYSSRKHLGSA